MGWWPYFLENDGSETVLINAQRYCTVFTDFLWPILDEMDIGNVYFQYDGTTSYTSGGNNSSIAAAICRTFNFVKGNINWPSRLLDLTPLDFFLWGYVKDKVYANNPPTNVLKNNIRAVIADIDQQICGSVIQNFFNRLDICEHSRDDHLMDIVFHNYIR